MKLMSSRERKRHSDRHVHVVDFHDKDPDQVLVQVKDRTQTKSSDNHGHHEFVLMLHNPSRDQVDKAVREMVAAMNARPRGSRR